jgi:hypothetical protein
MTHEESIKAKRTIDAKLTKAQRRHEDAAQELQRRCPHVESKMTPLGPGIRGSSHACAVCGWRL